MLEQEPQNGTLRVPLWMIDWVGGSGSSGEWIGYRDGKREYVCVDMNEWSGTGKKREKMEDKR